MTTWLGAVLDVDERRPGPATAAATLGVFSGGATLIGATIVFVAAFSWGAVPWGPAVAVLVQVSAGVLLLVGGVRLGVGAGRGVLLLGVALEGVTCVVHVWYVLTSVTSDPDDAALAPVLLTIAGVFAALAVVTLCAALRPSVGRFLSG